MKIADREGIDAVAASPIKFCGVYAIVCDVTKMAYIGSSKSVASRYSSHKHYLNGRHKDGEPHSNRYLQADWDIYGEEAFSLVLLEECHPFELVEREQAWLEFFGIDYVYNVFEAVRTHTPQEVRESISRGKLTAAAYIKKTKDKGEMPHEAGQY